MQGIWPAVICRAGRGRWQINMASSSSKIGLKGRGGLQEGVSFKVQWTKFHVEVFLAFFLESQTMLGSRVSVWCFPGPETKIETNKIWNPREVQVHVWEVRGAEVEEQDWSLKGTIIGIRRSLNFTSFLMKPEEIPKQCWL